jgi:hypothetical protein
VSGNENNGVRLTSQPLGSLNFFYSNSLRFVKYNQVLTKTFVRYVTFTSKNDMSIIIQFSETFLLIMTP